MGACACASDRDGVRIGNAENYMDDAMCYCEQALAKEFEMRTSFPYVMNDLFDESKSNSNVMGGMLSSTGNQMDNNTNTVEMRLINDPEALQRITDEIWNHAIAPKLRPKLENEYDKFAVDKSIERARRRSGFDRRIQHKLLSLCVGRVVQGKDQVDVAPTEPLYGL
uniref:Uncharacterized protein n=1 Tax=Lotharella oceanica TaxID=641309 RepID=A0A7S2TIW5_9EUKA|mmetsp:Transcript_16236/g.30804  ORF Transcript_16236/g.30804 Transcript_16236/m.30804 type:complete len:167 (+) Transcript_16236:53-553(+)